MIYNIYLLLQKKGSENMKIAVDGMGGDNAPLEIVKGCVEALNEYNNLEIYITGPEDEINKELSK